MEGTAGLELARLFGFQGTPIVVLFCGVKQENHHFGGVAKLVRRGEAEASFSNQTKNEFNYFQVSRVSFWTPVCCQRPTRAVVMYPGCTFGSEPTHPSYSRQPKGVYGDNLLFSHVFFRNTCAMVKHPLT